MSRYRIELTKTQESTLLRHCADARYVWNLCVEQECWWRAGRYPMPGFAERCLQLTAVREANPWLAEAKAGLNRGILGSCWGLLVRRLQDKAPGRVEKVNPAYTSQRCSACGRVDAKSRKSQAVFACTACGYACHADVNAARNIAPGHAVTARGPTGPPGRVNREPQLVLLPS